MRGLRTLRRICPCYCIEVIPYEDEKGNRRPAKFEIDMARCLFCGLCEDACPADAIALGQQYEFSSLASRDLVIGRDDLLGKPGKSVTTRNWATVLKLETLAKECDA